MRVSSSTIAACISGLALALVVGACQVFLEQGDQQCQKDGDCSAFAGATCDTSTHLCVTASTSSGSSGSSSSGSGSGGGSCTGDAGCWACAPTKTEEFLNACTDAACEPFDKKRLTHLTADGGLPQLP